MKTPMRALAVLCDRRKLVEAIKSLRSIRWAQGYSEGYDRGRADGYKTGHADGQRIGLARAAWQFEVQVERLKGSITDVPSIADAGESFERTDPN